MQNTDTADKRLPRAVAGQSGVDPRGMSAFLDYVRENNIHMNSIMVVRHGAVAYEGYWAPYRADLPHALHSVTKGLVSTAFGLLIAEGRVTLDSKVISFFPDYEIKTAGNWDTLAIRHLLSMTCGHDRAYPFLDREDYQTAFFDHPLTYEPGTFFCYTNLCFYTLCNILKRITGKNLQEYLQETLFDKMGVHSFTCGTSPTGISHGASLGFLTTEDMAKVGLLYLNQGKWGNEQLLPAEWVAQASAIQIADTYDCDYPDSPDGTRGYGFALWRCTQNRAYRFWGIFGQHILVLPEQDAVIVTTGAHAETNGILGGIWKYLLPAMTDDVQDAEQTAAVHRRLNSLEVPRNQGNATSPFAEIYSGTWLHFPENKWAFLPSWLMANRAWPKAAEAYDGIHSCKLDFEGTALRITLREGTLENCWTLNMGGEVGELTYQTHVGDYAVAARAVWLQPDRLELDMVYLNFAQHMRIEFAFSETGAQVLFHELPFGAPYRTKETRTLEVTMEAQ